VQRRNQRRAKRDKEKGAEDNKGKGGRGAIFSRMKSTFVPARGRRENVEKEKKNRTLPREGASPWCLIK